jgi:hypothetical protein
VLFATDWPRVVGETELLYVADEIPGYLDEITQPGDVLIALTPSEDGDPFIDGTTAALRLCSAAWMSRGQQRLTLLGEMEV